MDAFFDSRLVVGLIVLGAGFTAGTILGHRLGSRIGALVSAIEARLIAVEQMLGIGANASAAKKSDAPAAVSSPVLTTAATPTQKS